MNSQDLGTMVSTESKGRAGSSVIGLSLGCLTVWVQSPAVGHKSHFVYEIMHNQHFMVNFDVYKRQNR